MDDFRLGVVVGSIILVVLWVAANGLAFLRFRGDVRARRWRPPRRGVRPFIRLWRELECEVTQRRAPRSWGSRHKLQMSGWVLPFLLRVFGFVDFASLSRWLHVCIQGHPSARLTLPPRDRKRRDRSEERAIDWYVVIAFVVVVGAYFVIRLGDWDFWNGLAIVLILYILGEMIVRTISVVLFDRMRGHPAPANIERSAVLFFANYVQVVFGFAAFAQLWVVAKRCMSDCGTDVCEFHDSLWISFKTATLTGLPECDALSVRVMFGAELVVALFILVVLIAWGIANLPRRAS